MGDKEVREHLEWLRLKGRAETTVAKRHEAIIRARAALGRPLLGAPEAELIIWRTTLGRLADASIIQEVSHVRCFYAWAVRYGHLDGNPAERIPVLPMPDYEPHPISEDDLETALEAATGRLRLWLVLGGWCGMRCVEIAGLRKSCVHRKAAEPYIEIRKDATKGRRGRSVMLAPFALEEIGAYRAPAGMWMFPSLYGDTTGHVSAHVVSNVCNAHLHGLGIAATMHWTRHRYGTELLDATGNLRLVQDQLGHADPKTTAKYTRVSHSRAAAAAALLPVPGELRRAG